MNILQQSSKALDRTLGSWYVQIASGAIKLPRFQRFEAWDRGRVTGFLNTIIQNLPVGITLLLQVGDKEKFVSRYIATAPESNERVTEHLLDGQQRLTAFWRAMHNNYMGETFYVYLPQFDTNPDDGVEYENMTIHCLARWVKGDGRRFPIWADSAARCLERGLVPVDLLCPGDHGARVEAWVKDATAEMEPADNDPEALTKYKRLEAQRLELRNTLTTLRERVTHFNLPYLALPVHTDADVALQVFVNMNTNSKPLSMYDLTVAKVESAAGASLHELQEQLEEKHVELTHYGDISQPILHVAALLQGFMPNQGGVGMMDKAQLVKDWPRIERAMVRTAGFMARQHVYDETRLPTNVVIPVLAACFDKIPDHGDELGKAEQLMRAYMWSSFFTTRYEGAAATRAYQDYKALMELLQRKQYGPADYASVPVMRRVDYPLPTAEQLVRVGWPKGMDRTARAVLAVNLYFGAWDFADGRPASYDSLKMREYHHVFPDALLQEAEIESYLALNCALVTWKTNRTIGRKDPLEYLKDRVDWSDETTVKQRLETHLLDYEQLAQATYSQGDTLMEGEGFAAKLAEDFSTFLKKRALLVEIAASYFADGRLLSLDELMKEGLRRQEAASTGEAIAQAVTE